MLLELGPRRYDVSTRTLVMGILNRTPDSFYDQGAYYGFDAFLRRADEVVAAGADILDVGGVKAAVLADGVGPDVDEQEELDRVVPAVAALAARFDTPISVDSWRASVAKACFAAGAVIGNDISGFRDADFLPVCSAAGASVVATHIGPVSSAVDVVDEVVSDLAGKAAAAEAAGISPARIIVDAGLDLRKTPDMSIALLHATPRLFALGYPVLLAASNKDFLGWLHRTAVTDRREGTMAAHALGAALGCRILRAHDVRAARRVAAVIAAILEAE
jgi:dihydropteroate synthase